MTIKRNYFLLCAISFLQGFIFYGPVSTVYRQQRGLSMSSIFIIESIFMVLMIAMEIPWGHFADKFGYKLTLVLANMLFFISKIVFFGAYSFEVFLLERVFMALALSGISGCDSALLYASVGEKDSEKAFGMYTALSTLGFFIASISFTAIVSVSVDFTALLTIFPYGIAAVLSFFLKDIPYPKENRPHILSSISTALKNRGMVLFILSFGLFTEVTHSVTAFLSQLQYLKSGLQLKAFGLILAGMHLLPMLSASVYKLTQKFSQGFVLKALYGGVLVSCFALAFTKNPILSIILIGVIQGAFALSQPISSSLQNKSISTSDRATILSIYAMGIDVTSAVTNLSVGWAADKSVEMSFIICGIFSALAFLMVYFFFRKSRLQSLKA